MKAVVSLIMQQVILAHHVLDLLRSLYIICTNLKIKNKTKIKVIIVPIGDLTRCEITKVLREHSDPHLSEPLQSAVQL